MLYFNKILFSRSFQIWGCYTVNLHVDQNDKGGKPLE